MPGGGAIMTTGSGIPHASLGQDGRVAFLATLDLDIDSDWIPDSALFVWDAKGTKRIVGSGDVLSIGTVWQLQPPPLIGYPRPLAGAVINGKGEVLTQLTTTDYAGYLLVGQTR